MLLRDRAEVRVVLRFANNRREEIHELLPFLRVKSANQSQTGQEIVQHRPSQAVHELQSAPPSGSGSACSEHIPALGGGRVLVNPSSAGWLKRLKNLPSFHLSSC